MNLNTFLRKGFNLPDRILVVVIAGCLPVIVIGLLLFLIPGLKDTSELIVSLSQTIAEWLGLALLLRNGTIMQSKYWKYVVACLFILFLAFVFKVMHLPGAMLLLFVGFFLLELVYTIRFVLQSYTNLTGWVKYGWICSWCVVTLGIYLKEIPDIYLLIPSIWFWITFILFLNDKKRIAKYYRQ